MRKLIAILCCTLLAAPGLALAQDKGKADAKPAAAAEKKETKKEPSEKQKAQQERMKDCNAKATEISSDAELERPAMPRPRTRRAMTAASS